MNGKNKFFYLFCVIYSFSWSIISIMLYKLPPLDTIEAVLWGHNWPLGNGKHPPLSGYLANFFCSIFDYAAFPVFLLSGMFVCLALIYSYKMAREFFEEEKAQLAALVLIMLYYYNFSPTKFNVNVMQLALWPMTAYYFYRSVKFNRISSWIMVGILGAALFWSKYSGLLILFTLFIYMVSDAEGRKRFASFGPYLAGVIFLFLVYPHVKWLIDNNFPPLEYMSRSVKVHDSALYRYSLTTVNLLYPLLVIWAICRFAASPWKKSAALNGKWLLSLPASPKKFINGAAFKYAVILTFVPMGFMELMSFCGSNVDTMWCFPIYFASGVLFLSYCPHKISDCRYKLIMGGAVLTMFFMLVGYTIYSLSGTRENRNSDPVVISQFMDRYYREQCGRDIPLLMGDMWFCAIGNMYLNYHPDALVFGDSYDRVRFLEKLKKTGALVVTPDSPHGNQKIKEYLNQNGLDIEYKFHDFPCTAPWGKVRIKRMSYGITEVLDKNKSINSGE